MMLWAFARKQPKNMIDIIYYKHNFKSRELDSAADCNLMITDCMGKMRVLR